MKTLTMFIILLFFQMLITGCRISTNPISENNNIMEVISIRFEDPKPKYFGSTGVNLYSVKSTDNKEIVVNSEANAISLYKVYWDLAIFLSNNLDPDPNKTTVETFSVYGNSIHRDKLKCDIEDDGLIIVGYLNIEDVRVLSNFLKLNSLNEKQGVKKYYQNLKPEVKNELEILLEEELFPTLNDYLTYICDFVSNCEDGNSEILLIYSP